MRYLLMRTSHHLTMSIHAKLISLVCIINLYFLAMSGAAADLSNYDVSLSNGKWCAMLHTYH